MLADENHETSTPEAISSPSFHPSTCRQTADCHMLQIPSKDNKYVTPLQQPQDAYLMSNYQNNVPELDVDESTYQQQQRPDVLRGEVYFNFHDDRYRLLHNNERIDPWSIIYHEGRDQC